MTDERLYTLLKGILDQASEDEYPELCAHIYAVIDEEEEKVYEDALYVAELIHESDETKPLLPQAAAFLLEVYTEAIDNGNADAACNLGALYYTGRGGEQSYAKALKYYDVAAKGGCRQAQENLGYCYYYGRDTEVDYEKAFHYFALGAFDGHLRSLYKIGDMYLHGQYVEKNATEAFHIYVRCAETMTDAAIPHVGADVMMRLGDCYFEGLGTEPDYAMALKYYQDAERLFFDRLMDGDFLINKGYEKVIRRQEEVRIKMSELLPSFDWTK